MGMKETFQREGQAMNDNLLLGPDLIGGFRNVTIKGIHRKRMPVRECRGSQTASFALKKVSDFFIYFLIILIKKTIFHY